MKKIIYLSAFLVLALFLMSSCTQKSVGKLAYPSEEEENGPIKEENGPINIPININTKIYEGTCAKTRTWVGLCVTGRDKDRGDCGDLMEDNYKFCNGEIKFTCLQNC